MSSTISQYYPPPPAKTIGGGGRISREICRFSPFGPSFGGEGSILREKCRVSGNHQHNRKGRFIRLANDGNSLAENDTQLGHAVAAGRAAVDFKGAKRADESGVDLFLASRREQNLGCQFTPRQTGCERLRDHVSMAAQRRSAVSTVANHRVQ